MLLLNYTINLPHPYLTVQYPYVVSGLALGGFVLRQRIEALGGRCASRNRSDGHCGAIAWFKFPLLTKDATKSVEVIKKNAV